MNITDYENIPRLYTALAQTLACFIYCAFLTKRVSKKRYYIYTLITLGWLSGFLLLTQNVNVAFWFTCMAIAVFSMFLFIYSVCNVSVITAVYYCMRAFLLAELVASFEWQMVAFIWGKYELPLLYRIFPLIIIYAVCFYLAYRLEKSITKDDIAFEISIKEMVSAIIITMVIFCFSNLSFVYKDTPFSSRFTRDIFNIRTLIDFAGITILYAYHTRIYELNAKRELNLIRGMLKSQYDKYRNYQDSMEMMSIKYHDIKHQIAGLKASLDIDTKNEWITALENEVNSYRVQKPTGNSVLDTIISGKTLQLNDNNIKLTCVANGNLIDFIHVTDICTIFGNALDNAIESLVLIEDKDKRLIHLTIQEKKGFLLIKVENYCDNNKLEIFNGIPKTTKVNKENHGFGIKSIKYSVKKYNGTVSFSVKDSLFVLSILIPIEKN